MPLLLLILAPIAVWNMVVFTIENVRDIRLAILVVCELHPGLSPSFLSVGVVVVGLLLVFVPVRHQPPGPQRNTTG